MTHYHGTTECNCDTWRRAELVGIVLAAVAAYVVLPPWLLVVAAAGYWIHLLRSRRAAGPSPGEVLAALAPTERKVTASASSPTSPTSPVALPPAITPLTEPVGEDEYRITPFIFTSEPEEHAHGHEHDEDAAAPPSTRRDTPRDIKAALLAPAIMITSEDDDDTVTTTTMNAAALSDAKAVDAKIDKILGGERGPNISHGRRRRKLKAPPAYSATANKLETVLEVDHGADNDDECVSDTELDYAQPPPYAPSPILGPTLVPPTAGHHRSHSAGEADFDAAAKAALRLDVEREIERIERQRQLERERARELEREQRNVDPLVAAELLAEIQRARELHAASVQASTSTSSPKLRPRSDSASSTATRRLPRTPLARLSLPDDSDTSSVFSFDLDAPYDGQVDADIDELLLSPASMVSGFEGESSSAAARAILRAKSARSRIASIRRKRTDSGETADSEASSPMSPQDRKGKGSGGPGTPVDRKGKGRAIPSLPPMSYAFGSPVVLPATPRWREGRSE
ncbi:uncharacterized protein LOC62_01G001067 [Vanrija pseudolonga]|uniref:Uncharacterized protein n=1 Tax=Vanrija pseudolonga TaxID=143232 RepID=A0AAF1BN28_9TREE|nr:hypothetical protein LOC62_01G001067 [Vanrija pseudolonga]